MRNIQLLPAPRHAADRSAPTGPASVALHVVRIEFRGTPPAESETDLGGSLDMTRSVAIVGAPSNIGIRPYDNGEPRLLDRAPEVLRDHGLVERLGAVDLGDVVAPAYRDFVRLPGRARNEHEVAEYRVSLADRVAGAAEAGGSSSCWVAIAASSSGLFWARGGQRKARSALRMSSACRFRDPGGIADRVGGQHVPRARGRARRFAPRPARGRRSVGR